MHRWPFKMKLRDIFFSVLDSCLKICRRTHKVSRLILARNRNAIYKKGVAKVNKELDILNILRKFRQLDILINIMLPNQAKVLMNYQKKSMLTLNDSSDSELDQSVMHHKMISFPNPIVRAFYYHQLKIHLGKFSTKPMKKKDKRILLGLFTKNVHKDKKS